MMKALQVVIFAAFVALAGCDQPAANQAVENDAIGAAKPTAPKRPTYCFFKDAETKAWRAARNGEGNVAVTGKAHVKDARYKAQFSDTDISASRATLWLTIAPNTTGYASPENWWDVATTVPGSAAVTAVTLMCGKKTVAELSVR